MHEDVRVAIVGGGVTGLCAAHHLSKAFGPDAVLLLEGSEYVGGHTRTDHTEGFSCDWGPNGFLNREPLTLQWVDELGLTPELVSANEAAAHRFILKDDRLIEIVGPPKFLLAPLLSVAGRARLLCEPFIKTKRDDTPESVWNFAARRIGKEAADMMVGPMVSGIFAGDAHALSLSHCFPRMASMERDYGSLFQALLAKKKEDKEASAMGPKGVLTSFAGGIGHLAATATAKLGTRARSGLRVTRITKLGSKYKLETNNGLSVEAASVVLAVPAFAAAEITRDLDNALSGALGNIAYADCVVICSGYRRSQVAHNVNGFGFLVPRNQGKRVLGCLWTSSIFPTQAPDDFVLLRTIYGGFNDADAVRLSDTEILEHVHREVHPLMGIASKPEFVRIFRHIRGIPQYLLSHGSHLREIEAAEARHPGLVLAGNAYRGVGLNDCVVSAHRAVTRLTA